MLSVFQYDLNMSEGRFTDMSPHQRAQMEAPPMPRHASKKVDHRYQRTSDHPKRKDRKIKWDDSDIWQDDSVSYWEMQPESRGERRKRTKAEDKVDTSYFRTPQPPRRAGWQARQEWENALDPYERMQLSQQRQSEEASRKPKRKAGQQEEPYRNPYDNHPYQKPKKPRLAAAALAATLIAAPAAALWEHNRGGGNSKNKVDSALVTESRDVILQATGPETRPTDFLRVDFDSLGLRGKHTPGVNIFTDVQTEKNGTTKSAVDVVPIIKIRNTPGGIVLADTSPTGMKGDVRGWFEDIVTPVYPLIEAAFEAGGLDEVVFDIQKFFDPKYYLDESKYNIVLKKTYIDLNPNKDLNPLEIQATIIHEVGHSLFGTRNLSQLGSSRELPPAETFENFHEACSSLRDFAVNDLERESGVFIDKLNALSRLRPDIKGATDYLISAIKKGTLNDLFPGSKDKTKIKDFVPQCTISSGTDLLQLAAVFAGTKYDLEGASNEVNDLLLDIEFIPQEFARAHAVYRAFTEETYGLEKGFGHPYDDLDETAGSMLAISMLFPDKFGRGIASLSEDQKKAVLDLYQHVMNEYRQVSPKLAVILSPKIDRVLQEAA